MLQVLEVGLTLTDSRWFQIIPVGGGKVRNCIYICALIQVTSTWST